MNQHMFVHHERDTFSHDGVWESPKPNETPGETTDRLVLHGLRCGKRRMAELAYHAGFATHHNAPQVTESLRRLQERRLVKQTADGHWQLA